MGNRQRKTVCAISALIVGSTIYGQTVIADSTYIPGNWSVSVFSTFGASESHTQYTSGGNPDAYRYMEHILPAPPGPADLTTVEVTHIYNGNAHLPFDSILYIDFSEDIRLLSLPWEQAFIRSFPAIRQSGKLFRATSQYLTVIADTSWTPGTLTGLTANDFVALDGSDDLPDFSENGDFLFFGFWRVSSRGFTAPPFPPGEDLVYQHGSDNFTVTIHDEKIINQPPTAITDEFLYLDYFSNSAKSLPVLLNDSDPDGDSIRISEVDQPAFGGITEFTDQTISYTHDNLVGSGLESDFFLYQITDGLQESLQAFVHMYFCVCPLECIGLFLADPPDGITAPKTNSAKKQARFVLDSLDIDLFRRFRDEVLIPTETGGELVELYYQFAPEVIPLLLIHHRDLGRQAFNALGLMQDPISNLLDGDGTAMITQELIDSVNLFLEGLLVAVSDTLHEALDSELVHLCPLQDLAGLTVSQAMDSVICDTMKTGVADPGRVDQQEIVLYQNFPNPFSGHALSHSSVGPLTQISYHLPRATDLQLQVYDIHGRRIRTLVDEFQQAGQRAVHWDGKTDQGNSVLPGIYYYQLRTSGFSESKAMLVIE